MTNDDMRLVRAYAEHQREDAFAALVFRYTNLVYSAALRQTRDAQLAEEITQVVFILLARKAASLGARTVLTGWLYRTTCYVSRNALKRELRRQHRERKAYMQSEIDAQLDSTWSQLAPLLDEAMLRLGHSDRDTLVLRFFEGRSSHEIGSVLGVSEEAAKKRVNRALGKLRRFFSQRGVTSSAAMIVQTISVKSVQAAPASLANSITAVAMAKGATAPASTLTLIKGALKIMAWSKAKTVVVAGALVLLATGTTTVTIKEIQGHRTYSWQTRVVHYELLLPTWGRTPSGGFTPSPSTIPPQVRILPARYPGSEGGWAMGGGGLIGLNQPAIEVVKHAFGDDPHNIFATNLAAALPRGRYDFIANLPSQSKDYEALQQMLEEKWGVIGRRETLNEDVMRLVVKSPSNLRLKADTSQGSYHMLWKDSAGRLDCGYSTLPDFANFIGLISQFLIVDDTGLSGHYDFDLACSPQMIKSRDWKSLNQGLDPLGLELVPANVPVEMRVVEKIN